MHDELLKGCALRPKTKNPVVPLLCHQYLLLFVHATTSALTVGDKVKNRQLNSVI